MNNKCPLMLLMLFCSVILTSCSSSEETLLETPAPTLTKVVAKKIPQKSIETEILALVNDYRVEKGLTKLVNLDIIKDQAHSHTAYMISNKKISHDNFYKRKNYLEQNANAIRVGENVAYGYTNAKSLFNAWLKSESHKKNIEGDYNHFEISAEKNTNGVWYYTNIFIKK